MISFVECSMAIQNVLMILLEICLILELILLLIRITCFYGKKKIITAVTVFAVSFIPNGFNSFVNEPIFVGSPVISTVNVFGVTSTICPLNMFVYCIISDFVFSSGACTLISANSLFIVFLQLFYIFVIMNKYNPPTLIYTCGPHDDRRLFIPPKAERM